MKYVNYLPLCRLIAIGIPDTARDCRVLTPRLVTDLFIARLSSYHQNLKQLIVVCKNLHLRIHFWLLLIRFLSVFLLF